MREAGSGRIAGDGSAAGVSLSIVVFVIEGEPDDDGGPLRDMGEVCQKRF